jgi:hypothetical protein
MSSALLCAAYEAAKIEQSRYGPAERLDVYRNVLEPYFYSYMIENYGTMFQRFWETYQPPLESENAYVIVERRAHPNFRFVLQNMAWAAPHMAVYIFCSDENRAFIEALLGDKIDSFHVIEAFKGNVSREEGKNGYNHIMTDYRFYESIQANYILTIQMDNIIRRKIPDSMFIGHYWGNPWAWRSEAAGGGGATVRNVEAMIRLCRTYRPDPTKDIPPLEDAWVAERTTSFPSFEFRKSHLMESIPSENPVVLHQFWTFTDAYLEKPRDIVIQYWTMMLTLCP